MMLQKIRLNQLEAFINSDEYREMDFKPITPLRATSYLNNPHASPDDCILYLLTEGKKLIAFRSLWSDRIHGESETFAWLSGNWVHPDFRRKGLSKQLLDEAFTDWNGRLMFTNYAPESLQLYLQSQKFQAIHQGQGERFYLFAKTAKLLSSRYQKLRFLFPLVDLFIRLIAFIKIAMYKPTKEATVKIEVLEKPDAVCAQLLETEKGKLFLNRNSQTLDWVFNYPWISTTDKQFVETYPFSSYAANFQYTTLKFYSNGNFAGFLIYSIREGHLKPLLHFLEPSFLPFAAKQLSKIAAEQKIEMITILDQQLADAFKNISNPFILHKKMEHKIFSSFKVKMNGKKIQAGDGDFLFT